MALRTNSRPKGRVLNYRGIALLYAVAVAMLMLAAMLAVFKGARDRPVVMAPINCPDHLTATNTTCWRAQ